jgi:hypothetical protein
MENIERPVGRPSKVYKHSINGVGVPATQYYVWARAQKRILGQTKGENQFTKARSNQTLETLKSIRNQVEVLIQRELQLTN